MSAKLFNESQQSERPQHRKTIKKIDDLILDAEIEAQAEISQKLRSNNTKMLLVVLLGVGLFYVLFSAVQNQTIPVPSFLMEEAQLAQTPPVSGLSPKPIPFPVTESASASVTPASTLSESLEENLSPLENEVMTMIQKNLGEPGETASGTESEPGTPTEVANNSPSIPAIATPTSTEPEWNAMSKSEGQITAEPSSPKSTVPQLTEAQSEFFIQVGAFSVKANADRAIKKLASGGFSPLVQTRTTRSSMYAVFIGGFADKKSPENMISELKSKGLNPVLKKNGNGSYSIVLGKEKSKGKADALKQKLAQQGIFTSLKQMKIDMRMFIVHVGGFGNNSNAVKGQKKLENLGYRGTLIRKKS